MAIHSYQLIISYEGTLLLGWQKNKEHPTVEYALECALKDINLPFFKIEGSSRTDAGVHAKGQVARLDLEKPLKNPKQTLIGLNSKLPNSIKVISLTPCANSFHPTLDAKQKTYEYHLCLGPAQHPCYRLFSWHVPHLLNLNLMKESSKRLMGKHNFQAMTNRKSTETYSSFEREVHSIEIIEIEPMRIKIVVQGNQFMYKMVRNLVGMLVQIARGKILLSDLEKILESKDRRLAPLTAPAHGLCLSRIDY